eukprot:4462076-Prymnesium_polylepis.2
MLGRSPSTLPHLPRCRLPPIAARPTRSASLTRDARAAAASPPPPPHAVSPTSGWDGAARWSRGSRATPTVTTPSGRDASSTSTCASASLLRRWPIHGSFCRHACSRRAAAVARRCNVSGGTQAGSASAASERPISSTTPSAAPSALASSGHASASMHDTTVHSIAFGPPRGGRVLPPPSRAAHASRMGAGEQSAVERRIAFCKSDAGSRTARPSGVSSGSSDMLPPPAPAESAASPPPDSVLGASGSSSSALSSSHATRLAGARMSTLLAPRLEPSTSAHSMLPPPPSPEPATASGAAASEAVSSSTFASALLPSPSIDSSNGTKETRSTLRASSPVSSSPSPGRQSSVQTYPGRATAPAAAMRCCATAARTQLGSAQTTISKVARSAPT